MSHRVNTSVTIFVAFFTVAGTWEQKFPKEMTHYRNFRVTERISVRVPMMSNKGNYLTAADHELECDVLQVGSENFSEPFSLIMTMQFFLMYSDPLGVKLGPV